MHTKPRHKGAAPQPDQLAAVRRLADSGRLSQARQRHAALRKAFPDFKPLLALAWEIESQAGYPIIAVARAWEWQRASPSSRLALEALRESAREAGLAAVMARALQRLQSLDAGAPVPPPLERIDGALGPLTLDQAEALDLSRMHLADDNPDAAVAVLRGVDHPSARNNLALALFGSGELQQALALAEAAWQADADNLFALERALRWRCWVDGMARCAGFRATLSAAVPRRPEDATARIAALRFLGDDEGARAAWQQVAGADYWEHAAQEQADLFTALGEPEAEQPGEASLWFPQPWMKAMRQIARDWKALSEAAAQPLWDARLDACDAHVDYLRRACELGDAAIRLLALAVLKRRAKRDDAAREALSALLVSLGGPDSDRVALLEWLNAEGLRDPAVPAQLLAAGSVRPIRSFGMHIDAEPRPSPFSPAGTALAERMHDALGRRDLDLAYALALELRALHPEQAAAVANLAVIAQAQGATPGEVTSLYREALALGPEYLFARCGLARCLVDEGRIDEARALLEGLFDREQWHWSEYRSFTLAQRALALAQGEHQSVRILDETLRDVERRFGG